MLLRERRPPRPSAASLTRYRSNCCREGARRNSELEQIRSSWATISAAEKLVFSTRLPWKNFYHEPKATRVTSAVRRVLPIVTALHNWCQAIVLFMWVVLPLACASEISTMNSSKTHLLKTQRRCPEMRWFSKLELPWYRTT